MDDDFWEFIPDPDAPAPSSREPEAEPTTPASEPRDLPDLTASRYREMCARLETADTRLTGKLETLEAHIVTLSVRLDQLEAVPVLVPPARPTTPWHDEVATAITSVVSRIRQTVAGGLFSNCILPPQYLLDATHKNM